jgi:hypothetical protein
MAVSTTRIRRTESPPGEASVLESPVSSVPSPFEPNRLYRLNDGIGISSAGWVRSKVAKVANFCGDGFGNLAVQKLVSKVAK